MSYLSLMMTTMIPLFGYTIGFLCLFHQSLLGFQSAFPCGQSDRPQRDIRDYVMATQEQRFY